MSNSVSESGLNALNDIDIHDRVMEAYYGKLGGTFMQETQERIHWICSEVIGNKVMDIGCSQGIVPILLAREGCQVIGVDTSPKAIDDAQSYLDNEPEHVKQNVTYINEDFVALDAEHYEINTLVLSEVLEHLVRPEVFVKKASKILKKTEGTLVVTVPFGINAFIDHKKTFYLLEPYLLLAKHFGEVRYVILGKWIGFVATKPGIKKDIDKNLEKFIEGLEKGFYALERKLREDISRQSKQLIALREKYSTISYSLSETKEKYREKSQSYTELREKYSELQKTQKERLAELSKEHANLIKQLEEAKKSFNSKSQENSDLLKKISELQKEHDTHLVELFEERSVLIEQRDKAQESFNVKLNENLELFKNFSDLQKELISSNDKRKGHYQKLILAREDVKKKNLQTKVLEKKLSAVYDSAAYQIGTCIKNAKTLKGFIKLPLNLYRVYSSGSKRKRTVETVVIDSKHKDSNKNNKKKETEELQTLSQVELFSIEGWPVIQTEGKPTVMSVMDEFTEGCFEHDLNLINPRPDNWKALAKKYQPDLFFIESAWKGNGGSWQYRVGNYSHKPGNEVEEMTQFARLAGVPSVFWNKEDPVHHEKFMCSAKLVDYIFTTDANMIESYKLKTRNDNVYALPFAAQPAIHKPAALANRISKSCFAGSWYGNRHAERGEAMAWLLRVANRHGLDIFDRNYGSGNFPFPDEFANSIKGSLPYKELCAEYSRYRVFLNVNSVTDSPTMFSRRVFELLASGTPVVSTYAKGIEDMFGSDVVWLVHSEEEANVALQTLMNDDVEWRKRSLAGIRKVFSEHTYAHRLNQIFSTIGSNVKVDVEPLVVLIVEIDSEQEFEFINNFLANQQYKNYKLFIKAPSNIRNIGVSLERTELLSNDELIEKLKEIDSKVLVGSLGVKMQYGPYYLTDLVAATKYEPDAIGWAISVTENRFVYGSDTVLGGGVWRGSEIMNSFVDSEIGTTVTHERLYCIDSDQFQRG